MRLSKPLSLELWLFAFDSQGAIVSTCDKGFSSEDMIMIIHLKKVSLVEIMS